MNQRERQSESESMHYNELKNEAVLSRNVKIRYFLPRKCRLSAEKNETFAWRADRAVKWQLSLSVQDNFRQIKRCKISTEEMRGIYPLNSFNLAGIVVFTGFLNAGGFGCLSILMSG